MNEEAASSELSLAVAVARRYYLRDESKVDIARFLGVSRFKVARLLGLARSSGLVHVEIREPREAPDSVAARLRLRYQLTECHVVPCVGDGENEHPVAHARRRRGTP